MKISKDFNFAPSRRLTNAELEAARQAIQSKLKVKLTPRRAGRPLKPVHEKYRHVHIMLHPKIIQWAKALAKRRGSKVGYQTIINETLLGHAA